MSEISYNEMVAVVVKNKTNWATILPMCIFGGFLFVLSILIFIKFFRDHVGKAKIVNAMLINKQHYEYETVSKMAGRQTKIRYVLVFDINGDEERFDVSSYVYDTYDRGQHGILKYKGSRFIYFGEKHSNNHRKRR